MELQVTVVQLALEGHPGFEKTLGSAQREHLVPRDVKHGQDINGDVCGMPGSKTRDRTGATQANPHARQTLAVGPL